MEKAQSHKRTLLWLSAHAGEDEPALMIGDHWQLIRINPRQLPAFGQPEPTNVPVGVCHFGSLGVTDFDLLQQWLESLPTHLWLALVHPSQLELPRVRQLIQDYCQDYHSLPADGNRLRHTLGHLWGMSRLHGESGPANRQEYSQLALDARCQGVQPALNLLRRFAATHEPVLIYGESGTGREAAARFVHQQSSRRHRPLVTVNCAALPPSLTQSELFGHERGAFTHALKARKGRIEAADGGTLVLAGADELNLEQQAIILRFLQEGQIEPVGANRPILVDVRIIAICNTPLEQQVENGRFREDVLYRLGNLSVTMPPLRHRLEDLRYLAEQLLALNSSRAHRFEKDTLLAMARHPWPGNLRELQSRLAQAVLLSGRLRLRPEDLGLATTLTALQTDCFSLAAHRVRADREAITTSLSLTHQNISAAARLLKISRVSLYRLLEKHQPATHHADPGRGQGETL